MSSVKPFRASAPGKIILFGEHAVVYNQPAIALPFASLSATAEAKPAPTGAGLSIEMGATGQTLRPDQAQMAANPLLAAAQLALQTWGLPTPDLAIELASSIPMGGGFGSGAAISAVFLRALAGALGQPLDNAQLNAWVYETEKFYHGTPSGIDNTVIVYNQPVYFVRDQPLERFDFAPITGDLLWLVASSGVPGSTKETVAAVRQLYEADRETYGQIITQIGAISRAARAHLQAGGSAAEVAANIGPLMLNNQTLLAALTVSSPRLEALVTAAMKAGAAGAKLSGGGRGGNVIALTLPAQAESVREALLAAGATTVWDLPFAAG
jgi:mevalonate kinase